MTPARGSSSDAVKVISAAVADPNKGLPEEIFLMLTRLTPMVNVDLLIQDSQSRTLLTWREDEHAGPGWHIPGGIIRYKESMLCRVHAVAALELGAEVQAEPVPIAVNQIIEPGKTERAHFISLLFRCALRTGPDEALRFHSGIPRAGQWKWLDRFPEDMLGIHRIYRNFFPH